MATKVKPTRLQITWTPQVGQVPTYVDKNTFAWWAWWWGGGWDVSWPSSSTDWDIVLFDWATGKLIKDSWVQLSSKLDAAALSNTAYWSGWDWDTTHTPTKDAVYDKINSMDTAIGNNTSAISTINWKIPSAATASNQLADKNYVDDSINSVTAYYITKNAQWDQWATRTELFAATTFYSGGVVRVPTKNDYTIVLSDEQHDNATTRYIYNNGWEYQYTVNETALTQAQLNALNSWITAAKVTTYDWYASDIASKQDELVSWVNIRTINWTSILWSWDIATPTWIPSQTWEAGKFLTTDWTSVSWWTVSAWVTSVNWNTWAVTVREVPSVWTNWQVLTVVSWAAAWANAAWSDYSWVTKTISWWEIELWLRTIVNVPTSNFTLTAPATLKDWEEYAIRIISETSYTMTLWTWFTNPRNVDTTLSGNATDQYVFLAIWGELELQPLVDTWA